MAIRKKVKDKGPHAGDTIRDITVPSFSYTPSDELAKVIIKLWNDPQAYHDIIEDRDKGVPTNNASRKATDLINATAKLKLERAVIITEEEHDDDYVMQDPKEVVFVLPNKDRATKKGPDTDPEVLATVRLLMACTPNGI